MEVPSGFVMMLKAFGIAIPPETVQQINQMLPELPAKIARAVQIIDGIDQRLTRIESQLEELNAGRNNSVGAGSGPAATGTGIRNGF